MIVMKFGGTSLGDAERIYNASKIIQQKQAPKSIAVVLSAVAGVTNLCEQLLTLYSTPQANILLANIETVHLGIANGLAQLVPSLPLGELQKSLREEFNTCRQAVTDLADNPDSRHLQSTIITTGERLSVQLMLAVLNGQQVTAHHLAAAKYMGVRRDEREIDAEHTDSFVRPDTQRSRELIADKLDEKSVFVMEGFYGLTRKGELRTFGRNGSDLSAVALGVIVNARQVEIWTDVKGVYNMDPRVVSNAFPIERMSFDDMARMAHLGATVVYPQAVHELEGQDIELHIKCTMQPEADGTIVSPRIENIARKQALGLAAWDNIQLEVGEHHHFIYYFDKTAATPKPLFDFEEDENPEHVFHLTPAQRHEMLEQHRNGDLALALLSVVNINGDEESKLLKYLEGQNIVVVDAIDNHMPDALSLVIRSEDLKAIAVEVHHCLFMHQHPDAKNDIELQSIAV